MITICSQTLEILAPAFVAAIAAVALVGSLSYASAPIGIRNAHILLPVVIAFTAIPPASLAATSNTLIAHMLFALNGMLSGPQGAAQTSIRDRFGPQGLRTQTFTLGTSLRTTFSLLARPSPVW